MLKLLLITVILVFFVMLGLSVRLLFKQKSEFRAGCSSYSHELKDKNISCGCGSSGCNAE
jgi:hypothetical protein